MQSDLHEHCFTSHHKYSHDVLVTHINHLHIFTHDHMLHVGRHLEASLQTILEENPDFES